MSKVEKIIELIGAGKWASAISDELGVSRQYVYQVAERNGLEVPRNQQPREPGSAHRNPKPRLITGGVPVAINHSVAGTISELLVAADLMARGWQVFLPVIPSKGHDVIASNGQRLLTVEVRSAHRNSSGVVKYTKKADCQSDVYGIVITGEPVVYEPDIEDLT